MFRLRCAALIVMLLMAGIAGEGQSAQVNVPAGRPPNYAQRLVIETLKRHPDVLVVAFHITPPGEEINRVVAINNPNFLWRPSDEVDTDTAKTGKIVMQVIPATHRMEVHMPLWGQDGRPIATFVTVYLFKEESQVPDLLKKSLSIRDEIQPGITGIAQLLAPAQ